jgi:hypothetical protein
MTQYKTDHYHKSANNHEHNEECGKVITQDTDPETDVFVLWGKYKPHEHNVWTETSYLKHPRQIQKLQAPHFEAEDETSRQCVGTNGTLHYPAFNFSGTRKRIQTSRVQHCHECTWMCLIKIRQNFLNKIGFYKDCSLHIKGNEEPSVEVLLIESEIAMRCIRKDAIE